MLELLLFVILHTAAPPQEIWVLLPACVKPLHSTTRYSSLLVGHSPVFPLFHVTVDCMDPTCSGRGVCVRGECHCSVGWGGTNCESPRATCLDQCSGHGTFLPDTGLCSCDPSWTGHDCSIGKCWEKEGTAQLGEGASLQCAPHSVPKGSPPLLSHVSVGPRVSECFPSFPERCLAF